ncbi:hypothetical protein GCM10026987_19020 [Belliella aquatica]|uniref:Uncharacterized protein n=1 Tax=Belliella aquatica TaxID=1323734 RepID=A0ABQ1MMP5_9BACT|nr:hypothetical protein GCM10010993_22230 [Belliella aquatica]
MGNRVEAKLKNINIIKPAKVAKSKKLFFEIESPYSLNFLTYKKCIAFGKNITNGNNPMNTNNQVFKNEPP